MRIIAGEAKGRRISTPVGMDTRPTTDRVKESLFNILGEKIIDSTFLDLYAGSGSLGLEAISRGAKLGVFIDSSKEAVKVVKQNISLLNFDDYCEVYHNDALSALNILHKRDIKFDLIFLDPPYHKEIIPVILGRINENSLLKENGVVVTEHDVKDVVPESVNNIIMIKSTTYGNTKLSFYKVVDK